MESPAKVDITAKHTLHEVYPKKVGFISLLFLVGNVGLQIFSHLGLSAVVLSNQNPNPEESTFFASGAALNDTDFQIWLCEVGLNDPNTDETEGYPEYMETCATAATTASGMYTCLRNEGVPGTDEAVECLATATYCTRNTCGGACLVVKFGDPTEAEIEECNTCVADQCISPLEECLGFVMEAFEDVSDCSTLADDRRLLADLAWAEERELADEPADGLYEVYEVSFISSIKDAINGEAYGIAIIILVCSGIWPYTKNIIMFIAWFVPMTAATRSTILKNLTRLAKWSMVDVFAIVIIVCGVRIEKQIGSTDLIVLAEPRAAIVTFAFAAVWDLVQGEWMRAKHLALLERCSDQAAGTGSTRALVNSVRFTVVSPGDSVCSKPGKAFWLLFCVVQVGLTIAGIAVACMSFSITGLAASLAGTNYYEYSAGSLFSTLVSSERLELMREPGLNVVLMIFFLVLVFLIPIAQYMAIAVASFAGWTRPLATAVDIGGGFACLDVFVLSFGVVIAEWDNFINKAIGAQAQDLCPTDDVTCLGMESEILAGLWVLIAAVVLGWVSELFFTYAFAQAFHPVEQIKVAEVLFGKPMSACLTESGMTTGDAEAPQPSDATTAKVTEVPVAREVN